MSVGPAVLFGLAWVLAALSPADIVKRTSPGIVSIRTSGPSGEASGSGFLVDPSGTIVTNLHVVAGATKVAVKLANGDVFDRVDVRAFDARKDLAILQVQGFGLATVELGDSDSVQPGEPVVLIGNPLGLEGSISAGVVSGIRPLEASGFRVIQTDAAANPGSSGGPLLNSEGRVIGVLSFKLRGAEGLNFVIPINYARGMLAGTESFDLQELARRTASADDLFAADRRQEFPSRWRSLASGTTKIVRVDGENLYVETAYTEEERRAGVFHLAELRKVGDKYSGNVRGMILCSWNDFTPFVGWEQKVNRCADAAPMEITLLTASRIEGVVDAYPLNTKIDCGKCRWKGRRTPQSFTWIPE